MWLARFDNLHMIQWFGKRGLETQVSAYFTPEKWWQPGANTIITEQQQVYLNVLDAMEPYLPARIIR